MNVLYLTVFIDVSQ